MKPYRDPTKFLWVCPICFEEKTAGGDGHCHTQACAHMKKAHRIYEFAGDYYGLGLTIGRYIRGGVLSEGQIKALKEPRRP